VTWSARPAAADGDTTFQLGDRELLVTPGGLVFVPRGTAHTVWNSGDGPVRGLIVISPGDAEHEFVPVETS
jgi:mannose-6-phosphate isomerase-like protein (cupin superfamily)